ncbi:MAG: hypothetical protein PHF00_01645 [Elusimicrobia bacterium]|nr:hypothetical protein [Elusimicrobiota bacterium]
MLRRIERRVGFLALPDLPLFLAGMNAAVGVLSLFKPEFPAVLALDPAALRAGQVWRALTFLFIPPETGPLWLAVWILVIYAVMRALERSWGELRLTIFFLSGAAAVTAAALAWGAGFSSGPLQLSAFLAFARLQGETRVLLFFFLPVKVRWLGALAWLWVAWTLLAGGAYDRVATLSGLANYALFFGREHWEELRRAAMRRR